MRLKLKNRREFLFVRHGQTDWNVQGLLQGRSDRPLTDKGLEQAKEAAQSLSQSAVGLIVSSPLARARDTALVISQHLGVPTHVEPQFIERKFGSLEGRPLGEVEQDLGTGRDKLPKSQSHNGLGIVTSTALPPDAEPWEEISTRVLGTIDKWLGEHPTKKLVIVSHFGVMAVLYRHLCGEPRLAKNAVPYRFSPHEDAWEMTEIDPSSAKQ